MVETVTFKNNGATRLTTAKTYDNLNRLSSITNTPLGAPEPPGEGGSASSALSAFYRYNSANQRTKLTRETNAYWDYGYDSLGQVTSAAKKLSTGIPVLGHDFSYTFDDIGNRKTATANGLTSDYTANLLNQYDSRSVPGAFEVSGDARPDAKVTITSPAGSTNVVTTIRQDDRFYRQLTVDNSTAAQYRDITITGVKNNVGPAGEDAVTEVAREVFVPASQEAFTHDADGNLTADARWTYTWDGENRLAAVKRARLPRAPEHRGRGSNSNTTASPGVCRRKFMIGTEPRGCLAPLRGSSTMAGIYSLSLMMPAAASGPMSGGPT